MGKTISVTSFEEMAKAAKKLQDASINYAEISGKLMNAASTMGAAWEGADNVAFVEQITGFSDDLKNMADKLSVAGEALDKQKENYVQRQNDNATQVKKLAN